jgi:hypothetical protein
MGNIKSNEGRTDMAKEFAKDYRGDASTPVTGRLGCDGFNRTALKVEHGKTSTFDLIDEDGNLLCRINASLFESGMVNVDTIFGAGDHNAQALIFSATEGRESHPVNPQSNLIAAFFKPVPEEEWGE